MKKRFIKAGGHWTHQLDLQLRDLNRAMMRGQGPARNADEFPIEALANIPKGRIDRARNEEWPAAGIPSVIVCAAWLLRDLESSAAVLSDVTLHETDDSKSCGWCEWLLPASKTDPTAQGVIRALACACPSPLCPVLAMRKVITASELARQLAIPPRDQERHPLICKADGSHMSKDGVVKYHQGLAVLTDIQDLRITGHSCRVAGAKRMALAGHPIWTIQVFGRWGSKAILGYVREALLGHQGRGAHWHARRSKRLQTDSQ